MREKEFLPLVSERLGIEQLNDMQRRMLEQASQPHDIILLSPTGSGKTLAFVLPVLKLMRPSTGRLQAVVIAPSRELVLQIAGVIRQIARGFKVTALYGGHSVEDEVNSLSVVPDIVVATPGRLLDHSRRRNIDLLPVRMLVLDEFDKSLELGFEEEMRKIYGRLKNVSRVVLTSATDMDVLPDFLNLTDPVRLDFAGSAGQVRQRMRVHRVQTDCRDKLEGLAALLSNLTHDGAVPRTIVFVNHRESAERVASFLKGRGAAVALYHGGLEQRDRETAIAMFNNGSTPVLVATDLAARGLDIEHVEHIVHYHQPLTPEAYTHRNGRTARVKNDGDIYVLVGPEEDIREFVGFDDDFHFDSSRAESLSSRCVTLCIGAGKKEKISRGDIAGFLIKEGGIDVADVGKIDVYDHYSLVAVSCEDASSLAVRLSSSKIKGRRQRVTIADGCKLPDAGGRRPKSGEDKAVASFGRLSKKC